MSSASRAIRSACGLLARSVPPSLGSIAPLSAGSDDLPRRATLGVVTPRTARFALVGAIVVTTAALFYERTLPFSGYVYRRKGGPWIHEPPRAHAFGFELSPMEGVVWFILVGALAGGLLGVALARVHQREWTFMLGGAGLIGTVGFVLGVVGFDEFCIGGGDVFSCDYNSFFGWEIAPLAGWALWTGIGALMGGFLGRWTAAMMRRAST